MYYAIVYVYFGKKCGVKVPIKVPLTAGSGLVRVRALFKRAEYSAREIAEGPRVQ